MAAVNKNNPHYILTSKTRTVSSCNFQQKFKPVFDNLNEYTENTTIHGMKYLGLKKPLPEKLYWIIIFVTCFVCLGFFINEIVVKWKHNFVILVEDDMPTPIHKIPFPAITICPQVKIRKTEFSYQTFVKVHAEREINASVYSEYLKKFQLAQQVCHYKTVNTMNIFNSVNHKRTFLNKSHIELLHEISPQLKDMLLNEDLPCTSTVNLGDFKNSFGIFPLTIDNFSTILTNEGVCFTLNLQPQLIRSGNVQTQLRHNNNTSNPKQQISRIKINLTSNKSDVDSLCQPTQVGYKIILHPPEMYPTTFEKYIAINHESLTRVRVQPKMITTSEGLRRYKPKHRQCYFSDERQLKFYKFYNRINCKLECFSNYTLKYYGCVHFAFPRNKDTPICGENIDYFQVYELVESIESLLNFESDSDGNKSNFNDSYPNSCNCLNECNSIEYDYSAITETFRYDKLLDEISSIWNSTSIIESPSDIEIFWNSPHFKGSIRKPLCTFSDLVSQFGGLLGLFMGASILSIFEIIYFCVRQQFTMCARSRIVKVFSCCDCRNTNCK